MSFFSEASLAMIPSGYKTSKVYSAIPTSGDGDLTFSRSNDTATRVGPDGLIEKVRTNLVTYSNTFSNADWLVDQVTKTTGQTDPNGGTTAVLLTSTNTSSTYMYQTKAGLGCLSIYAKVGTRSTFSLIPTGYNNGAFFDLSSVTATASGIGSLAKIESVGGGWFRCSVATSSSTDFIVSLSNIAGTDSVISDTMTFAFAQGETGDIATPYIATTSAAVSVGPVANVPRLDYLDSSYPRLLLEPQRTNLALNSETITAGTGATVSLNNATSPDGYVNADKLVEDTSTGFHRTSFTTSLGGSVDSSAYCISIFAKAAGRTRFAFWDNSQDESGYSYFDLSNGTVISGTGKIENYGNGWYRCSIFPLKNFSTNSSAFINLVSTGTTESYTGNGTSGVLFWGKQLELAAYVTSYIPTLGAAVTRGSDAASKTGISSLIGQTEGTIFIDVNLDTVSAQTNDPVLIYLRGTNVETYIEIIDNGGVSSLHFNSGVQATIDAPAGSVIAGRNKFAFTYKQNDFALYLNGVLIGTDTSGTVGAQDEFGFQYNNSAFEGQQKVSQALVFPTRLSNDDLAALTA
jgi:hypothetical protein